MKHPRLNSGIRFYPMEGGRYNTYNELTQEEENCPPFSYELVRFARRLDGRDPGKLTNPRRAKELLAVLRYYGLLKESRFSADGLLTFFYAFIFPKNTAWVRTLARLWNSLLLISWLPLFLLGLCSFLYRIFNPPFLDLSTDFIGIGTVFGMVSGLFLHEAGHAAAGLAYGARVYELGVFFSGLLPGAYVLMSDPDDRPLLKSAQINAAGVETNFFLTGLFLILAQRFPSLSGAFLSAAMNNGVLAMLNLLLVGGNGLQLDGYRILSNFFNTKNLPDWDWIDFLFGPKPQTAVGKAASAALGLLSLFRICLPVLLFLNILEVVLCLFP